MSPFVMHLAPAAPTGVEFEAVVKTTTGLVSTIEVDLPPDLNGKLAIVLLRSGRSPSFFNEPTGWTKVIESSNTARMALYARVCDGSEGGTLTILQTDDLGDPQTGRISAMAWRVSGVATGEATYLVAEQDTVTNDPPDLTLPWGSSIESVVLAAYSSRRSDWSVNSYPTNYTELDTVFNGSENDLAYTGIAVGERTLSAASENPGAFTITAPNGVSAERVFTIGLRAA